MQDEVVRSVQLNDGVPQAYIEVLRELSVFHSAFWDHQLLSHPLVSENRVSVDLFAASAIVSVPRLLSCRASASMAPLKFHQLLFMT